MPAAKKMAPSASIMKSNIRELLAAHVARYDFCALREKPIAVDQIVDPIGNADFL